MLLAKMIILINFWSLNLLSKISSEAHVKSVNLFKQPQISEFSRQKTFLQNLIIFPLLALNDSKTRKETNSICVLLQLICKRKN